MTNHIILSNHKTEKISKTETAPYSDLDNESPSELDNSKISPPDSSPIYEPEMYIRCVDDKIFVIRKSLNLS